MSSFNDAQLEDAIRSALAGRAQDIQPATEVAESARGRYNRWLPLLLAAVVIAITTLVAGPHIWSSQGHSVAPATQNAPTTDYTVYRGHRWLLNASKPSAGYIELDSDGKAIFWNTQQQLTGTYSIKGDGQLTTHWTGVSSGMVDFDQTVVDKLSQFGDGAPAFIRSTDPATLVLEVKGDRLTFSK